MFDIRYNEFKEYARDKMKDQKSEVDLILETMADVISEKKSEPAIMDQDPFDYYVQRVQVSLFSNKEDFKKRVVKGYHTILSELKKSSD